jgi:hypothetical protein
LPCLMVTLWSHCRKEPVSGLCLDGQAWIERTVRGRFCIRRGRATGATQAALSGGKR